jgi:hypothetical protein
MKKEDMSNRLKASKIKLGVITAAAAATLFVTTIELVGSRKIDAQISAYPPVQQAVLKLAIVNQVDQLNLVDRLGVKLDAISENPSDSSIVKLIPVIAKGHKDFCDQGQNGLAQAIGLNVLSAQIDARTDLNEKNRQFLKTAATVALTAPCTTGG